MSNTKCPFCSPQVNKSVFASTPNFNAVYNLAPILPGHTLIIPKRHLTGFLDVDENIMVELVSFSRKLIQYLISEFKADGFDFTIQDGISAGQTIGHMHAHIVPRYIGDLPEPGDWYPSILAHEAKMLDSLQRDKIPMNQMHQIVNHLKTGYNTLFSL